LGPANHPDVPVLAQIGASQRRFPAIKTAPQLSQAAFRAQIEAARLVVAHAGMGTILTAAELGKPLILMPRRAKFNEHRNDHQQGHGERNARGCRMYRSSMMAKPSTSRSTWRWPAASRRNACWPRRPAAISSP
jgi:hypothetical protein